MKNNIDALKNIEYSMKEALRDFDKFITPEERTIIWHRVDSKISFASEMALINYDTFRSLHEDWNKHYPT